MIDLDELRREWKCEVCLYPGEGLRRLRPCWFGENVPGIDPCEYEQHDHTGAGVPEGAHWIKRQRVEKTIRDALLPPEMVWAFAPREMVAQIEEFVILAAWDPRNGVPACEKHHRRFDGQRVDARDPLVIWRHEVPGHVEAFCRDWPLEVALEDRNPAIGAGI